MLRRCLLTLIVSALLIATLLIGIAVQAGSRQPPAPALDGLVQGCAPDTPPCWYGIVPGVTKSQEADQRLHSLGYVVPSSDAGNYYAVVVYHAMKTSLGCDLTLQYGGSDRVALIQLMNCRGLRLGDVMALLGEPDAIDANRANLWLLYQKQFSGFVEVSETLSPYAPVISTGILPKNQPLGMTAHPWHGFLPLWLYCEMDRCP